MNSTLAEQRPFNYELQMQSVRTQLDMDRNKLLATMQSGMGAITDEMRSKQDDESVFLTPKSSPYSPNGAATYDIPVPFPTEFSELEQPAHGQLQPTSPYGLAAGSPDETYINSYNGSPPYSPPYDNSPLSVNGMDSCSSPGSCSSGNLPFHADMCSPTSIPCTSANQFSQFLPQTAMPIPTTSHCESLPPPFSTCCDQHLKNAPSISTFAYPQPQPAWDMMGGIYSVPTINFPTNEVSTVPVETPIIVQDQHKYPDQQRLEFYDSPSPQPVYPQNGMVFDQSYAPIYQPSKMTMPTGKTCRGRGGRKGPPKIRAPIQVDDSDIKDIPSSAQLWEFTLRVLKKPKYKDMVCWENQKEGLFRFHDAQAFAALWGKHRNRPNMTYDKVARALRYYYKRNIFKQVGGRLTYRFSDRLCKLYQSDD